MNDTETNPEQLKDQDQNQNQDLYRQMRDQIAAERGVTLPTKEEEEQQARQEEIEDTALSGASGLINSIGSGMTEAVFQTKDFLLGEPEQEDKSQFRQMHEATTGALKEHSTVNALTQGVSQFATGMVGAGKIVGPIKAVQKLKQGTKAARTSYEVGRGAAVGAVVLDPHEERLSDLIESNPALSNPVTDFLASDPEDSTAMGRLKNSLEGIGMDLALIGTFAMGLKGLNHLRRGNEEAGLKVLNAVDDGSVAAKAEGPEVVIPEGGLELPKDAPTIEPENVEVRPVKSEAQVVPLKPKSTRSSEAPEIEVDESQALINSAREDFEAIDTWGSREEAIAQGHKFSKANVPWQKIRDDGPVQELVGRTAQSLKSNLDARKGVDVLTDLQVRKSIEQSARLFNQDPDVIMGEIAKAGDQANSMVANLEASYLISRKLFDDAYDAAVKVEAGMLDGLGATREEALQEVVRRHMAASDMLASGNSMRAAAGRSMRRMRGEFAIKPEDLELFKSMDPEKLVQVLSKSGGSIEKLKQTANPKWWERVTDESTFLLTNNLLWNYPTHIVNTSTNLYMLAARPTEKLLGSFAMGAKGKSVRAQALREYRYTLASVGDAWSAMSEAFMRGDSVMSPHMNENFDVSKVGQAVPFKWKPVKDTWDLFYNGMLALEVGRMGKAAGTAAEGIYRTGVGLPTRSLGAVDEFVKTLRYRSVIQARAAGEASSRGLTGQDFKNHVQRVMEDSFTSSGLALDANALREAQISTFQQELIPGTIGAGLRNFRSTFAPFALILPYVKTPSNVIRYSVKMTPVLNLAQEEYRQMLKGAMGAEQQAHAVGQMAIGSMFMATAASLALEGKLTGGGPADNKLKSELMATGWKPYSVVSEDDEGNKTYMPLGRFDPVGLPFGIVADLVDIQVTHPDSKAAQKGSIAALLAISEAVTDRSFLRSLNEAVKAFSQPDFQMEKYASTMAGNLVPASSALKNYANDDTYLREARGFVDNMMRDMPGYSGSLPPRRDAFGEPIWKQRGLTSSSNPDLVEEEHNRIILETGEGIRPPSASSWGVDLRDINLKDGRNAYDLYQERVTEVGNVGLKKTLDRLIKSKSYQKLVDGPSDVKGTKLNALSRTVSKYREIAKKSLLRDYPELREVATKKQKEVRSKMAAMKNDEKPQGNDVEKLLKSMGY